MSCCSSTTRCGRATSCRCTASGATCGPTPRSRRSTGVPEEHVVLAEDGVVVDLVDGRAVDHRAGRGRPGLRRRPRRRRHRRVHPRRPAGPRRGRLHLDHRRGRLDHRPGRVAARRCPGAGSPTTRRRWTRCCRWWRTSCRRTETEGITDPHRIAQSVRRVVGRWVGETYRRRPMIVPTVIAV